MYKGPQIVEDKIKKLAEEALNRFAADLEAGKRESLRNYLSVMSRFHKCSWVIQETSAKILNELLPEKHLTQAEQRAPSPVHPETHNSRRASSRLAPLSDRYPSEDIARPLDDSPGRDR